MGEEVTIPLGGLNQIPGVSGLEDVTFVVPDEGDITDAVVSAVWGQNPVVNGVDDLLNEIRKVIEGQLSVDIPGEGRVLQNPLREIYQNTAGGIDLTDEALGDVVEAIEGATGVDVPGDGSVIDGVADVTLGREDVEDILREGVTDVLDDASPENVDVRVDGIFGPLSEDVARALEDIIGFDPDNFADQIVSSIEEQLNVDFPGEGDIEDQIPTVDDVETSIEDGLDGLSPDVNGVEFWRDPIAFMEELWDELNHLLLDPESAENLQQALDEVDQWDS